MSDRTVALRALYSDLGLFSRGLYPKRALRQYQIEAAAPLLAAVEQHRGGHYTILFPRQSGKDELIAQLLAYLLARYRLAGGEMVLATPTMRQAGISKRRLRDRLQGATVHPGWLPREGYRLTCGVVGVAYVSAGPDSNVRGETASLLLVANEAQDLTTEIWDSRMAPMTASTNAPTVYSGTPWAAGSLLSRQTYLAEGQGKLIKVPWQQVAAEVPAYGAHVAERMAQLGAQHPFILSEYCLQELDAAGGLFDERRQAQMRGEQERQHQAQPGRTYALLLDVAGADEDQPDAVAARDRPRRRDSTALTVVEVDTKTVAGLSRLPSYRVVDRAEWLDVKHSALLPRLLDLATNVWKARYFVVDATGIGAGLASLLLAALSRPGGRCQVIPYEFSLQSKSALGWAFLGAIESGRYKEYSDDQAPETRHFWRQIGNTTYTVATGPGKIMRWSVPEAKGHDDLVVSAGLVGALDLVVEWKSRVAVGRTREDF